MNDSTYKKIALIVVPILTLAIGVLIGYLIPHADSPSATGGASASATPTAMTATPQETDAAAPSASASGVSITMGSDQPQQRTVGNVTVTADAVVQGNPDAKVTITTISDMQCPHCARMHALLNDTFEQYIAGNQVKVEAKTVAFLGGAFSWYGANTLAMVADNDPESWAAVETAMFNAQAGASQMQAADYVQVAKDAGATVPEDKAQDMVGGTLDYGAWVQQVGAAVSATGVDSIPRLYVNGQEVTYTESAETITNLTAAVDAALAKAQ